MLRKNINLKLYDIDGCLYFDFDDTPIQDWLIQTNYAFFKQQLEEIEKKNYDEVIIALGTNRQDSETDEHCAKHFGSTSATRALPIIQNYFAQKLKNMGCNVLLDAFWNSDVHSDRTAGSCYKATLLSLFSSHLSEEQSTSLLAKAIFDHKKIALIYNHAHRVASLNTGANIVIDFYDDCKESILEQIRIFYQKNSDLLPANVTLRLHHYTGQPAVNIAEIKGTGRIDLAYKWSSIYMATTAHVSSKKSSEKLPPADLNLSSAAEIKGYHKAFLNDQYFSMNIDTELFDADAFKYFRDHEAPKLRAKNSSGQEACYTTAVGLLKEKLISPELLTLKGIAGLDNLERKFSTCLLEEDLEEEEEEKELLLTNELTEEAIKQSGSLQALLDKLYLSNKITLAQYLDVLLSPSNGKKEIDSLPQPLEKEKIIEKLSTRFLGFFKIENEDLKTLRKKAMDASIPDAIIFSAIDAYCQKRNITLQKDPSPSTTRFLAL